MKIFRAATVSTAPHLKPSEYNTMEMRPIYSRSYPTIRPITNIQQAMNPNPMDALGNQNAILTGFGKQTPPSEYNKYDLKSTNKRVYPKIITKKPKDIELDEADVSKTTDRKYSYFDMLTALVDMAPTQDLKNYYKDLMNKLRILEMMKTVRNLSDEENNILKEIQNEVDSLVANPSTFSAAIKTPPASTRPIKGETPIESADIISAETKDEIKKFGLNELAKAKTQKEQDDAIEKMYEKFTPELIENPNIETLKKWGSDLYRYAAIAKNLPEPKTDEEVETKNKQIDLFQKGAVIMAVKKVLNNQIETVKKSGLKDSSKNKKILILRDAINELDDPKFSREPTEDLVDYLNRTLKETNKQSKDLEDIRTNDNRDIQKKNDAIDEKENKITKLENTIKEITNKKQTNETRKKIKKINSQIVGELKIIEKLERDVKNIQKKYKSSAPKPPTPKPPTPKPPAPKPPAAALTTAKRSKGPRGSRRDLTAAELKKLKKEPLVPLTPDVIKVIRGSPNVPMLETEEKKEEEKETPQQLSYEVLQWFDKASDNKSAYPSRVSRKQWADIVEMLKLDPLPKSSSKEDYKQYVLSHKLPSKFIKKIEQGKLKDVREVDFKLLR